MSQTIAFTTARLLALECLPGKSRVYIRDSHCSALWVMVTAAGAKNFFVYHRVNGVPTRIKIGSFPAVAVDTARKEAKKLTGKIVLGDDPRAARRELRHGTTLKDLFDAYWQTT